MRIAFAVFWQESQGYDAARHFPAGKGREARLLLLCSVAVLSTNTRARKAVSTIGRLISIMVVCRRNEAWRLSGGGA